MEATIVDDSERIELYYPVSIFKFIVLSFLTLGVYDVYWFYKNWKYVQRRDNAGIMPFWRAIFSPLWFPALMRDVEQHQNEHAVSGGLIVFLSALYFGLSVLWRLPDPFWVLCMFNIVPVLPVVNAINNANGRHSEALAENSRWKIRHLLLFIIGFPIVSLTIAGSIGLVPSTQVSPGWMLWPHHREFLLNSNIVEEGEQIIYFYSEGTMSIETDGNLLTDRGVTSYWRDETSDEFYVERAMFDDIARVDPQFGNVLESTYVTVTRNDDSELVLFLSAEGDRDKLFLRELERRISK